MKTTITTTERLTHLAPRFGLMGSLLLIVAAALPACAEVDGDFEEVGEAGSAIGVTGTNDLAPSAIDTDPLRRAVTDEHMITTASNPNPIQLCQGGTVTSTGCTLKSEWQAWMAADLTNRVTVMKGIVKCAAEPGFTIVDDDETRELSGQWGLYSEWKTGRLTGPAKRERISSCVLTLLNGNHVELAICIVGPGGAPFNTACADTGMDLREGGFFGDLFADIPTAYVAGPDTSEPPLSGRACFAETGIYCCPEDDASCPHRIVLTGSILGSPAKSFEDKRCNAPLVNAGDNAFCPSFFSTREPGRSYTNVFTTFIPTNPE